MISRDITIERLATASDLLLAPFELNEASLGKILALIAEHQVDDADLYFQYTRSEGWSLEEGIVKTGSFSIDQGVGVRAVAGERTAFAYSDDISLASLTDAAQALAVPAGPGYIWAAGEHSEMAALRGMLAAKPGVDAKRMRIAAYWKRGEADHHENLTA